MSLSMLFGLPRAAVVLALALGSQAAIANNETEALRSDLNEIMRQVQQLQLAHDQQIQALQARVSELQDQLSELSPKEIAPFAATTTGSVAGNDNLMNIGLSGLFAFGGSSVDNDALMSLQAGAHDPNQNGFTVQNVELSIGAAVDPYLDAQAFLIFQIDAEGDTVVELEEAYFTTRALPAGLQLKGGQFFTEFGRQNAQHPHSWSFVDQPVILSRLFGGDGLRSQGARLSWLLSANWYSDLQFGLQNAKGETAVSFLNAPEEAIADRNLIERDARNFSDLLYSLRWLNGFDLSDSVSMNLGVSGLWGPNASGADTDTRIYGADAYIKWQGAYTQRGFPFVAWHTEVLKRSYEAGDPSDPTRETLDDWGGFTQALWGFRPGWVAGLRLEYATSDGDNAADPLRDTRKRLSPNLTWYPTDFSKVRFQYNRDWADHLPGNTADSFWIQTEFSLGSHTAHTF